MRDWYLQFNETFSLKYAGSHRAPRAVSIRRAPSAKKLALMAGVQLLPSLLMRTDPRVQVTDIPEFVD
jgi:hypothetical protein